MEVKAIGLIIGVLSLLLTSVIILAFKFGVRSEQNKRNKINKEKVKKNNEIDSKPIRSSNDIINRLFKDNK